MRGYFGIGVFNSKYPQNIGTLYRSALAYEADFIYTIGSRYKNQCTDTCKAKKHIPLFSFDSFVDLFGHLPDGCKLVGIEIDDRATPLKDFAHPVQSCYILGAEDTGLSELVRQNCDAIVQLPGKICLNVAVADVNIFHVGGHDVMLGFTFDKSMFWE